MSEHGLYGFYRFSPISVYPSWSVSSVFQQFPQPSSRTVQIRTRIIRMLLIFTDQDSNNSHYLFPLLFRLEHGLYGFYRFSPISIYPSWSVSSVFQQFPQLSSRAVQIRTRIIRMLPILTDQWPSVLISVISVLSPPISHFPCHFIIHHLSFKKNAPIAEGFKEVQVPVPIVPLAIGIGTRC